MNPPQSLPTVEAVIRATDPPTPVIEALAGETPNVSTDNPYKIHNGISDNK